MSDLKIDNSEQTLKVTGKGNKQRIIYLNSAVCEAINAYIKIHMLLHNFLFYIYNRNLYKNTSKTR